MRRVDFMAMPKPDKRALRMKKAFDKLQLRKVSEISKERAVQYVTAAFCMAMHELYGWSGVRSGRVISEATEKWGSYTKEDEHKLLDAAKSIGVDIEDSSEFKEEEGDPKVDITVQTSRNLQAAVNDVHLMMAACLVVLHDRHHFGEKRLNKVVNHMWQKFVQAQVNDEKSIMQMCEDETGICVTGGEGSDE